MAPLTTPPLWLNPAAGCQRFRRNGDTGPCLMCLERIRTTSRANVHPILAIPSAPVIVDRILHP
jgi:hypothetical protein